jgi:hypothetical protein
MKSSFGIQFYGPMVVIKLRVNLLKADRDNLAEVFKDCVSFYDAKGDAYIIEGAFSQRSSLHWEFRRFLKLAMLDYKISRLESEKCHIQDGIERDISALEDII